MGFSFKKFDASQVAPMSDRVLLPAGFYTFIIAKAEWVKSKSGSGRFLQLNFMVVDDGEYEQFELIVRLNLENAKESVENAAQQELARLYAALGLEKIEDEAELCDKPFIAKVGIAPPKNGWGESNEIVGKPWEKEYYHLDNDPRGVDGSPIVPKEEKKAAASGPKKMAWQK